MKIQGSQHSQKNLEKKKFGEFTLPDFKTFNKVAVIKIMWPWPGWVGRLARALPRYAKVVGSMPNQDKYKNQPVNA